MSLTDFVFPGVHRDWGGAGWRNILHPEADPQFTFDGSADDRAAWAALSTDWAWEIPKGTSSIATSLTIPSVRALRFAPGAKLKPASGATVTINCPVIAGPYDIYDLSAGGSIAFGSAYERSDRPYVSFNSTQNTGTGEDDLTSYTLPAGRLYENNMMLRVTAWGETAANANNKRVRLYIAGTMVLDSTALAANAKDWFVRATVIRNAAAACRVFAEGQFNGSAIQVNSQSVAPSSTGWDVAQIIKVTAEAVDTADIIQRGLVVEVSN